MRKEEESTEQSSEYRFPEQRRAAIETLERLREEVKTENTPAMRALVRQWENRVQWFERKATPQANPPSVQRRRARTPQQAPEPAKADTPELALSTLLPPL